MQDGAVFRHVDFLAPEHGVDAFAQPEFLGKLQQKLEGFVGNAVLRVIQVEAHGLCRHALAAFRVIRKELSQMQLPDILVMSFKGFPCLTFSEWRVLFCHVCAPYLKSET